jgi:hypothetical protein
LCAVGLENRENGTSEMFDEKVFNDKVKEATLTNKNNKTIFTLLLQQRSLTSKAEVINPCISEGFRLVTRRRMYTGVLCGKQRNLSRLEICIESELILGSTQPREYN